MKFDELKIHYEDDVVKVIDDNTKEVLYQGLEDYEELKREDWNWNEKEKYYELTFNGRKLIKRKLV